MLRTNSESWKFCERVIRLDVIGLIGLIGLMGPMGLIRPIGLIAYGALLRVGALGFADCGGHGGAGAVDNLAHIGGGETELAGNVGGGPSFAQEEEGAALEGGQTLESIEGAGIVFAGDGEGRHGAVGVPVVIEGERERRGRRGRLGVEGLVVGIADEGSITGRVVAVEGEHTGAYHGVEPGGEGLLGVVATDDEEKVEEYFLKVVVDVFAGEGVLCDESSDSGNLWCNEAVEHFAALLSVGLGNHSNSHSSVCV